jgi:hypothetical protein
LRTVSSSLRFCIALPRAGRLLKYKFLSRKYEKAKSI